MSRSILRIDASARTKGSVTRELTDRIVSQLGGTVTTRDLTQSIPHISADWVDANFTPADQRTEAQKAVLALSDALVAELQAADTIVIGLPIYNFSMPAALKAWVDMIARAGLTFQYTETGPKGLLSGKRAFIAVASGGVPVDSPVDFATPYLRQVLNFIGITDIDVVSASQMATAPETTLAKAHEQVAALAH